MEGHASLKRKADGEPDHDSYALSDFDLQNVPATMGLLCDQHLTPFETSDRSPSAATFPIELNTTKSIGHIMTASNEISTTNPMRHSLMRPPTVSTAQVYEASPSQPRGKLPVRPQVPQHEFYPVTLQPQPDIPFYQPQAHFRPSCQLYGTESSVGMVRPVTSTQVEPSSLVIDDIGMNPDFISHSTWPPTNTGSTSPLTASIQEIANKLELAPSVPPNSSGSGVNCGSGNLKVEKQERNWQMQYEALEKFCEEHGHCNVPFFYETVLSNGQKCQLGYWLGTQRKYKKQNKLPQKHLEILQRLVDQDKLKWSYRTNPVVHNPILESMSETEVKTYCTESFF